MSDTEQDLDERPDFQIDMAGSHCENSVELVTNSKASAVHMECRLHATARSTGVQDCEQEKECASSSDDEEPGGESGGMPGGKRRGAGSGSSSVAEGGKRRRRITGSRFVDDQAVGEDGSDGEEEEGEDEEGDHGVEGMDLEDKEAGGSRSHMQLDCDRIRNEATAARASAVDIRAAARARSTGSTAEGYDADEAQGVQDDSGEDEEQEREVGQTGGCGERPELARSGLEGGQKRTDAKGGPRVQRQGSWEMEEGEDGEDEAFEQQLQQQRRASQQGVTANGRAKLTSAAWTAKSHAEMQSGHAGRGPAGLAVLMAGSQGSGFGHFLRAGCGLAAGSAGAAAGTAHGGRNLERHAGVLGGGSGASGSGAGVQMTLTSFAMPLPRVDAADGDDTNGQIQFSPPREVNGSERSSEVKQLPDEDVDLVLQRMGPREGSVDIDIEEERTGIQTDHGTDLLSRHREVAEGPVAATAAAVLIVDVGALEAAVRHRAALWRRASATAAPQKLHPATATTNLPHTATPPLRASDCNATAVVSPALPGHGSIEPAGDGVEGSKEGAYDGDGFQSASTAAAHGPASKQATPHKSSRRFASASLQVQRD